MHPDERMFRLAEACPSTAYFCPRNKYFAMVGTIVLDRKYEASMAKTTASASGRNK